MAEEATGDALAVKILLDQKGHLRRIRREAAVAAGGDDNLATGLLDGHQQGDAGVEIHVADGLMVGCGQPHPGGRKKRV